MLNSIVANSYNPQNLTEDELVQGFVARTKVFADLFSEIASSPMQVPEQHFLVQGLRGMGKTTLLRRIDIEVRRSSTLSSWLVPILYREEEYSVGSLADLWELTAEYLEDREPVFVGLYQKMLTYRQNDRYEEVAFDTLRQALRQHHKKMLLLIDNIGDILAKLNDTEQQRLREILITQPDVRIIGATAKTLEPIYDVKNAFFGFFKVIHLKALSQAETTDLMRFLAEQYGDENVLKVAEKRPDRIEIMRRLTGGVTRTMILLYDIFAEGDRGSAFDDLTRLANNVTPLYKHRMEDLPPQQQKIVDALARAWDGATAREVAEQLQLESKTVSAQLVQLERSDIITKIETGSKSHLYMLSERFFNIWYLMRSGRQQDQRLLWLVRFLEDFTANDPELLQTRINTHLSAIEAQTMNPQAALYLTEAFSRLVSDKDLQHYLIDSTRKYLIMKESKFASDLGESDLEIMNKIIDTKDFDGQMTLLNKIKIKDESMHISLMMQSAKNNNLKELKVLAKNLQNLLCKKYNIQLVSDDHIDMQIDTFVIDRILFGRIIQAILFIDIVFLRKQKTPQNDIDFITLSFLMGDEPPSNISQYFKQYDYLSPIATSVYSLALIQENNFDEGIEQAKKVFFKIKKVNLPVFTFEEEVIILLLAKKQYNRTYQLFQDVPELKDRYKPLHYACLHFLKDEYKMEYLRMPPEISETVQDVLTEIAQIEMDYA